jgi:hypothetical protein
MDSSSRALDVSTADYSCERHADTRTLQRGKMLGKQARYLLVGDNQVWHRRCFHGIRIMALNWANSQSLSQFICSGRSMGDEV